MAAGNHYDVIIIGTGAGGGTLAYHLAPSGKRILLLERGGYLPREKDNWDSRAVFVESKYRANETWLDKEGKPFHPGIQYYVGGNTKVYGAALLRFRERDFGEVLHHGGVSPAWPLRYEILSLTAQGQSTFIMSTDSAGSIRRKALPARPVDIRR
jgi:choline dehydrogenase-like flavoprotein